MNASIKKYWAKAKVALMPVSVLDARIKRAVYLTGLWEPAREILSMMKKDGYRIVFDKTLAGTDTAGRFNKTDKIVKLNPSLPPRALVPVLLHEMRHYLWNKHLDGNFYMLMLVQERVRDQIILNRLSEADAQAFAAAGTHIINKKLSTVAGYLKKNKPPSSLTTAEYDALFQKIADQRVPHKNFIPEIESVMQKSFALHLSKEHLDDFICHYDFMSLEERYELYINPENRTTPPAPRGGIVQTLDYMRRLMQVGAFKDDPAYLGEVTTAQLGVHIINSASGDVRRIMKLMDRFEQAVANGNMKPEEEPVRAAEIHRRLKSISAGKPL